jgi:hypothetical protein
MVIEIKEYIANGILDELSKWKSRDLVFELLFLCILGIIQMGA